MAVTATATATPRRRHFHQLRCHRKAGRGSTSRCRPPRRAACLQRNRHARYV